MNIKKDGWTPELRRELRRLSYRYTPSVRELDVVVEEYVNWAVEHGLDKIHVYPRKGKNTNANRVRTLLEDNPKGLTLVEVSDE